jgi:hypothetical protein
MMQPTAKAWGLGKMSFANAVSVSMKISWSGWSRSSKPTVAAARINVHVFYHA